jgi:uncharacterized membrane protein YhaH (DUF805 family)
MNFIEKYFLNVIVGQFADFKGRATRKQFWLFVLINFIIGTLFETITYLIFGANSFTSTIIVSVYGLVILIPYIAIMVRRLHDRNFKGWWLLLPIISFLFFMSLTIAQVGESIFVIAGSLIFIASSIFIFIQLVLSSKQS